MTRRKRDWTEKKHQAQRTCDRIASSPLAPKQLELLIKSRIKAGERWEVQIARCNQTPLGPRLRTVEEYRRWYSNRDPHEYADSVWVGDEPRIHLP